ncbi:Conserved_hypothetical protein [Hexamita inflata]|uniref:Chaoptin n=1 Tax=Hexamita inflata TaxID=28002 RepID=A0AA86PT12_9EUKA|nr:Conserved hypothetical protein [Hexamita inflata]
MTEQPQAYKVLKQSDLLSEQIEKHNNIIIQNIYFKKLDNIPVHIKQLTIISCKLQSLKNLCNLSDLIYLDIHDNMISDISEIIIHPELTYLDISQNCIIIIDKVAQLNKLKTFQCSKNKIINIEPLIYHENFDSSWIQQQFIPDLKDFINALTPGSSNQKAVELMNKENMKKEFSVYLFENIKNFAPQVKNNHLDIQSQPKLTKIAFIDCLKINYLYLSNCPNIDLQNMPMKIKHLSIKKSNLKTVDGLQKITQLEYLDLSENEIILCEKLNQLKHLRRINLTNNKIIDLKNIKHLIQYLNTQVSNQSQPSDQDFMKYLGQQGTQIQLQELKNLMEQNLLSNNQIVYDTEMIQKYKDKVFNGVLEIIDDQNLTSVEFTEVISSSDKKISELQIICCHNIKLDRCPQSSSIKKLIINKCNLQNLNGIQVMTELTELNLSFNQISDISKLSTLVKLTVLELDQNNIESISVIQHFNELHTLDLSQNLISTITSLKSLYKLKVLDLSYNKLASVSDLSALSDIKHLNVSKNNITSIDSLKNCKKITHLNISFNKIISVEILSQFSALKDLRLEQNMIQNAFKHLSSLSFVNKNWFGEQKTPTLNDYKNSFNYDEKDINKLIQKDQNEKKMNDNQCMLVKLYQSSVNNQTLKISTQKELNNLQFLDVLKVKEFEAVRCQTIDFTDEQVPKQLLKLKLNYCKFLNDKDQISVIENIYQMEQLVELDLSFNKIQFISEICNLVQLQKLFLQNNVITNIPEELSNLQKLTELNISNNKIIFSSPLNKMSCKIIYADNNYIMDNMSYQNQSQPQIQDYKNFLGPNSTDKQAKEIQEIINYNASMNKKYTNYVKSVNKICIENDEEFKNFEFLARFDITSLTISNCPNLKLPRIIEFQEPVPIQLQEIVINKSKLEDVLGLDLLTRLRKIELVDNNINLISPLFTLTNVTELTVQKSKLTTVSGINKMKQLVYLNLGENQISDINDIGQLVNLQNLYLQKNDIYRINSLRALKKLTYINLSDNNIIFSEPLNKLYTDNFWLEIKNNTVIDNIYIKDQRTPERINCKNFLNPNSSDEQIDELERIIMFNNIHYQTQMKNQFVNLIQNAHLNIYNIAALTDFSFIDDLNVYSLNLLNCLNVKLPFVVNKIYNEILESYPEIVKIEKKPSKITSLSIDNCGLTNLNGLENIKQLKTLVLKNNKFTSIEPLLTLTNITSLTINHSKITDIIGIEKLKHLSTINLENNCILKIKPIKELVNLTHVSIDNNFIYDLQELIGLPNYSIMWISSQREPSVTEIEQFIKDTQSNHNLQYYQQKIIQNKMKNEEIQNDQQMIRKFASQVQNGNLSISNERELQDIQFVDFLNIQNLTLKNCSNLMLSRNSKNIRSLSINNCGLTNLSGIEQMNQLQELELLNNAFESIKPLSTLINIKKLTINNSQLTNIIGISQMKQLQYLNIRDNQILSIEPIQGLESLNVVLIDNNFIQDLDYLIQIGFNWIKPQGIPSNNQFQNYINNMDSKMKVNELISKFEGKNILTLELLQDEKYIAFYKPKISNKTLVINNDNIQNFYFVSKLLIDNLQLNNCMNIKLNKTPENILSLTINNTPLTNIVGLEKMKQLQYVNLCNNAILIMNL